ncbi:MAG: ABC transporter substrate-binding protein [Trueperaceae bacterium]|nr:ABC transporter substrate-binding protein [Trueperaceae bacterium]
MPAQAISHQVVPRADAAKHSRGLLTALIALILAAAMLAGTAVAQTYGGSITVAISADPPGWDPSASTSQEIPRVVYGNVFEGLVAFDSTGTIVPRLATDWRVSEDGLTWIFNLREGVTFHDGSAFTAADVVAKFDRARTPDSGHTNAAYYAAISDVSAQGDHVVVFSLSQPAASLLYNLARPDSIIYPAGTHETQRSQPIGTGAFRFASYTEGSQVVLEKYDGYWREGLPYLDRAVFRIISDPNTRFAALQTGDIDVAGVLPEQYIQLAGNPELKGTQGTATAEITVAMNNTRAPFDDLRVRQAITLAIDKNAIVNGAMFGLGTVIGSHMSPSEPYFIDLSETYPYDPQRARELLAEAGYPNGFTMNFELPEPYNIERRSGEVIAQQLREVGIDVQLSVVEWATWIERIFLGGDYDMTIIGHSEPRDINVYANPNYYYHYNNPRIAELLALAEAATDQDTHNAYYQEIATIIAQDAVNVWVMSAPSLVAMRTDIHGYWVDQPTPALYLVDVYRQ